MKEYFCNGGWFRRPRGGVKGKLLYKMECVLPPRGVEGSAVDGIGGGAFLWFFLVAVDKKEHREPHHDTLYK